MCQDLRWRKELIMNKDVKRMAVNGCITLVVIAVVFVLAILGAYYLFTLI